jgi:threonine/homoserine/homoserine lactone efflux protein
MDWFMFPRGVILGISIAAPVGPIGLLTIKRTISGGFRMGFVTGLGAATADAAYGAVAAFGVTAIIATLSELTDAIRLIGGIALVFIGGRGLMAALDLPAPGDSAPVEVVSSPLASYLQTVGLTLTNPATILSFLALFAGVGISANGNQTASAVALVTGVALGSALWWLSLTLVVSKVRHRLSSQAICLINIGSSVIITLFGLVALAAVVL